PLPRSKTVRQQAAETEGRARVRSVVLNREDRRRESQPACLSNSGLPGWVARFIGSNAPVGPLSAALGPWAEPFRTRFSPAGRSMGFAAAARSLIQASNAGGPAVPKRLRARVQMKPVSIMIVEGNPSLLQVETF